jgi:hypothetical protein
MTLGIAAFVLTQVVNHINAMITLAAGDLRHWSAIAIVIGLVSLTLSYWVGRMFGMQWVMVTIAIMDIPNAIFLFKRSLTGLKISMLHVLREAFLPVIFACLPLVGMIIFIKLMDSMQSMLSLISHIFIFLVLWLICVLVLGLSKSEKNLLRNKCLSYQL